MDVGTFARNRNQEKSQDRFGEISPRHMTAMRRCPSARILELTPLRYLMPQTGLSVLDLFSGSGYVSAALRLRFPIATLVDCSSNIFNSASPGVGMIQGDATQDDVMSRVPMADVAVCHAGFHHVLSSGGIAASDYMHFERRLEVLRLWKQKLTPGGRLIVSDVPPAGTQAGTIIGSLCESSPITLLQPENLSAGSAVGKIFHAVSDCVSIENYIATLGDVLSHYHLRNAEPAYFFDRVVSTFSPAGHFAHFASPTNLISLFESAGFSNVSAFVVPTPWLFETQREAIWFVHELLGLGMSCSDPGQLTADEVSVVMSGISRYLNLVCLPFGGCVLSWKLLFVVGENS